MKNSPTWLKELDSNWYNRYLKSEQCQNILYEEDSDERMKIEYIHDDTYTPTPLPPINYLSKYKIFILSLIPLIYLLTTPKIVCLLKDD